MEFGPSESTPAEGESAEESQGSGGTGRTEPAWSDGDYETVHSDGDIETEIDEAVDFLYVATDTDLNDGILEQIKRVADYVNVSGWVGLAGATTTVIGHAEGSHDDIQEFVYWMTYFTSGDTEFEVDEQFEPYVGQQEFLNLH